MSGNTKLLGFGTGNKITLQRWGKDCQVVVSQESWMRLNHACVVKLPAEPKKQPDRSKETFVASYDEATGRVRIDLDLASARDLYALLDSADPPNEEMLQEWTDAIDGAIRAHHDYHDLREPGVG